MTTTPVNTVKWLAVGLVLLIVGAGAGNWWARWTSPAGDAAVPANASGDTASSARATSGKRTILYWRDPMAPNAKFDKPGKSPFMDMQLEPVYADDGVSAEGVRINANVVQNLGIRVGKVQKVALRSELHAVGSVAFDERLLELVQSRVEGYVTRLYVRAPLERVHRGQPLADIQAPAWLEAEQEYLSLLNAQSQSAQSLRVAARERLGVLGIPPQAIRAIENQHQTTMTTTVYAPIDGVVSELAVRQGSSFTAGANLFRINGLATVWVNAQVPEAQASMMPVGASVEVHPTAWPGTTLNGRVIALLPEVAAATRTLTARLAVANPERKLIPGMYVSLNYRGPPSAPQLVVPSEALITTGERNVVIVAREGGSFDVTDVKSGAEADGQTAILSGLVEGDSVVLSGQFLIDSEASLKAAVSRLKTTSSNAVGTHP